MNTADTIIETMAIERMREQDLEEARAIQGMMRPEGPLRSQNVSVSHTFQPVTQVGGDFLDYFELADGNVGAYVGDVAGKGLPAAMYAALVVGTLRGVHKTGQLPSAVLSTLNARLSIRRLARRYAAMQYALLDPHTGVMQIASAGMFGPVHLTAGGCNVLELSGIPPGLFPTASYGVTTLQLQAGDSVLFFTDGIPEATNGEGESFGIDHLKRICEAQGRGSPAALLSNIFSAVEHFALGKEQHDDMAAVLLRWDG
jgi:phosphoserine phosphatase RsbU/P